ncbi:MAG: aspartate carbamoyltransferase catalytic subunit [Actinobacteria bacterium]|nr:aspartate carbamoyltransferase catalytic subunit [Actinomycetota bacterium]
MLSVKSILNIEDLSLEDINLVLSNADSFLEVLKRDLKKVPTLRGKTIINLFFEPSTRTKTSFELAAKRMNADLVNFSAPTSSLKKGESIIDTVRTIIAMKVDLIIVRHPDSGAAKFIFEKTNIPVINAGDGKNEHPTQALLDLYTIRKRFKDFKKVKVAIVGDILNSRVARSNIKLFKKMGFDVSVVSPPMLLPENMDYFNVDIKHNIDDVIGEVDVIYMLRMQFERHSRKLYPSVREYNEYLGLNMDRVNKMKKESIVMHPGPVNRGIEISEEVMNLNDKGSDRLLIDTQVTYGVAVRMALLYLLLG